MELLTVLILLAGFFVSWNIGANDASNAIGTVVGAGILGFRRAVLLVFIFALLGASLEGYKVIKTIGKGIVPVVRCSTDQACGSERYYCEQSEQICRNRVTKGSMVYLEKDTRAVLAGLLAACTFVFFITLKKLPVSTTQAIVGGVAGAGIGLRLFGGMPANINYAMLTRVFVSWMLTPFGSALFALIFYFLLGHPLGRIRNREFYDKLLTTLVIASSIFVAYNIGANDVANAVAPVISANLFDHIGGSFEWNIQTVGELIISINIIPSFFFAFAGGLVIGLGARVSGYGVCQTMGSGITQLDPLTAFAAQFASAVTVYFFTQQGIPVSTTQAIVGGVVGVGLTKGASTVNMRTLRNIALGWFATPTVAALLAILYYYLLNRWS